MTATTRKPLADSHPTVARAAAYFLAGCREADDMAFDAASKHFQAALRHIQAEVQDEDSEERVGAASRLHDALLAAIFQARGEGTS